MAALRLIFICFLYSAVSCVPTGFGFNSNWEQNKKNGPTHSNFNFNPIVPDMTNVPEIVVPHKDHTEQLFREYMEQEKRILETTLTFINSLLIKMPHIPPPIKKPTFVPYPHRDGLVIDNSLGKSLNILLNLTGFEGHEINYKIENNLITIHAIHEDQFYHRELRWTYQLPVNTDENAIHFDFQEHIMTISGILSEDLFAINQNLYHNEMRKKSSHHSYTHKTPYVGKPSYIPT